MKALSGAILQFHVVFGGEGGFMTSIASNVTINGGSGSNGVVYTDTNDFQGRGWTLQAGSTRWGTVRTFTLNDIQSQTLHGSNFHDNFFVFGTPPGSTLTINGNNGNEVT